MEGTSKRISPADWKLCAGCVVEFPLDVQKVDVETCHVDEAAARRQG